MGFWGERGLIRLLSMGVCRTARLLGAWAPPPMPQPPILTSRRAGMGEGEQGKSAPLPIASSSCCSLCCRASSLLVYSSYAWQGPETGCNQGNHSANARAEATLPPDIWSEDCALLQICPAAPPGVLASALSSVWCSRSAGKQHQLINFKFLKTIVRKIIVINDYIYFFFFYILYHEWICFLSRNGETAVSQQRHTEKK